MLKPTQQELESIIYWLREIGARIDLSDTDLHNVNLGGANLCGANLCGASLSSAYLCGANLHSANLCGASLSSANLCGANLAQTDFSDDFKIARLDFGKWSISVNPTHTRIGCQTHPNKFWIELTPEKAETMAVGAREFWTQHQASIKAVIMDVMGTQEAK